MHLGYAGTPFKILQLVLEPNSDLLLTLQFQVIESMP